MSNYIQTVVDKFELRVRRSFFYTEDDLWAKVEGAKVRVGVTDYLQRTSGDVAFVEIIKKGLSVKRRAEFGTLETAKTTISLLSPISGKIEETNEKLVEKPELVNSDPYEEGWLAVLEPDDLENDLKTLMSDEEYFGLMVRKLKDQYKSESG